jgi:hypothetical protein
MKSNFEFRKWGNGNSIYTVSVKDYNAAAKMYHYKEICSVKKENGKWIAENENIKVVGKSRIEAVEKLYQGAYN